MVANVESPKELWQVVEDGVAPIVESLVHTNSQALSRIRGLIDVDNVPPYFKPYMSPEFHDSDVYVTDRPEKIFGENKTIFTITSSIALENIQNGAILIPPSEHGGFHRSISTHRGIGLALFTRMMNAFGYSMGAKDSFVWLGSKVDGEQFVIEDSIAKEGQKADKAIAHYLFTETDQLHKSSTVKLNPKLMRLIEAINSGENLYESDPEYAAYVEGLLNTLHKYTGVREGWFLAIEGLLNGTIPPIRHIDPINLDLSLTFVATQIAQPITRHSQAILLEVDTCKLLESAPLYPFPISSRPPESIIPAPSVPLEAVKAIYLENVPQGLEAFQHLFRPMNELDNTNWLQDGDGRIVTPSVARRTGIDPRNPVCALRYNRDPISVWAEHIENGDVVPWSVDPLIDLINPITYTDQVLRKIINDQANKSGLFDRVEDLMGDRKSAEIRILSRAGMYSFLKTVRHSNW